MSEKVLHHLKGRLQSVNKYLDQQTNWMISQRVQSLSESFLTFSTFSKKNIIWNLYSIIIPIKRLKINIITFHKKIISTTSWVKIRKRIKDSLKKKSKNKSKLNNNSLSNLPIKIQPWMLLNGHSCSKTTIKWTYSPIITLLSQPVQPHSKDHWRNIWSMVASIWINHQTQVHTKS